VYGLNPGLIPVELRPSATTTYGAANGNTLVALASLTGDGSGSVSITFAGPPASITANTTVLGTMTGLSFDAPFTRRMTWSNFGALQ